MNSSSLLFSQSRFRVNSDDLSNPLTNSEESKRPSDGTSSNLIRISTQISKPEPIKSSVNLSTLSLFRKTKYSVSPELLNNEIQSTIEYRDKVTLRAISPFESIDLYKDTWPFLLFRKALLRIVSGISELSQIITKSMLWEGFILLVIMMNIMTLAFEGTSIKDSGVFKSFEIFYIIVYTTEAIFKIFANGLIIPRNSYLKEWWNYLDLAIIISGWVDYLDNSSINLVALRTLRVLRPLRGITSIKGLKVIVQALLQSIRPLLASLSLLLIYLLIFAIAGLQIWSGILKWQCMDLSSGVLTQEFCGTFQCSSNKICVQGLDNPNSGATNFDNILYSFLTVFQCVTLEGWTDTMLYFEKAYNRSAIIFFVILVFIGAYLLVSLTLVVIKSALTSSIQGLKKEENNTTEYIDTNTLMEEIKKTQEGIEDSIVEEYEEEKEEEEEEEINGEKDKIEPFSARPFLSRMNSILSERNDESNVLTKKITYFAPTAATGDLGRTNSFAQCKSRKGSQKNNSIKRKLSIQNITPMISRMNSSVKITKELMEIIKNGNELDGIMLPVINESVVHDESREDVIPSKLSENVDQGNRGFVYRLKSSGKEKKSLVYGTKELMCSKSISEKFRNFRYNSLRFGDAEAFYMMKKCVHMSISLVKLEESQWVVGEWSKVDKKIPEDQIKTLNSMEFHLWKSGFLGFTQKAMAPINKLVQSKAFTSVITFFIVLNTVTLSIDYYEISPSLQNILYIINNICTFIFVSEQTLKILGLGLKKYSRDMMNYLDILIAITSIIEFVFLSGGKSVISAFRAIRIFKLIRVIRIARLFRYLQSINHMMLIISKSLSKFAYVALLLLLFIIVFSLIGMQLFAGVLDFPRQSRCKFDQFYWAFLSIFQVLTIENWQNLLYDVMQSSAGPGSGLFLVTWVVLGNYILLNLFLAILLDAFTSEEEVEEIAPDTNPATAASFNSVYSRRRSSLFGDLDEKNKKKREQTIRIIEELPEVNSDSNIILPDHLVDSHRFDKIPCEYSFCMFSKNSPIRVLCNKLNNNSKFEVVILTLISLSSLKLVIETYTDKYAEPSDIPTYFDIILTLCFFIEFLIKSINTGFAFDKGTYIKDYWNIIDFAIVILSITDLLVAAVSISFLKIFRLFRTLRPLRFISHNISMKIVVNALLESIVAIMNVVLVSLIIWIMFAILGVSLFGGKLYTCSNKIILNRTDCENSGFKWESLSPNYDNLINAMITLFIISSEENWPDIMYAGIDAKDIGVAPELNYNPAVGLYFVSFIVIGSFFFMNLFIGVVFEQFSEAKKHEGSFAAAVLTKDQMLWVELQALIAKSSPNIEFLEPTNKFRKFCYKLTQHYLFEGFILTCIFFNMLQMATLYDGASNTYNYANTIINLIFTSIFIFEACLKLIGNGVGHYFKSDWNRFDFFVATSSLADIILTYFAANSITLLRSGPQLIKTIKLFRLSRLFRLFKSLSSLQTLLTIMKYSLPAIINVLSLLLLVFFIYAVMGVYLFGKVTSGTIINEYVNFSDFGMAILALFRSATGESWFILMYDCSQATGSVTSNIYFCSFITISYFIMLNLFIMVILQNYDDYQSNPNNVFKILNKDIRKFKNVWSLYSINNGKRVHYKLLPDIMYELGESLGIQKFIERDKVFKQLSVMELQIEHGGFVFYHDFLFSIMKRKYASQIFRKADKNVKKILAKEQANTFKRLKNIREKFYENGNEQEIKESGNFFIGMMYTKSIFHAWKNWVSNRKRKAFDNSSISITPRMTEEEFPGVVSERSSFIESISSYSSSSDSFD